MWKKPERSIAASWLKTIGLWADRRRVDTLLEMFRRSRTTVLRCVDAACIFCAAETPHDVLRVEEKARHGPGRISVRVIEICHTCGGHRTLPTE